MKAISKESILRKTHYGLSIYRHILRLYYPDEVVLRLVGRDCELCRNPFNANKETLHIFIKKERILYNPYDREFAIHEDKENAIPAGDAFTFAALHYNQQGEELLQTLNKELFLHIGAPPNRPHSPHSPQSPHSPHSPHSPQSPYSPLFSFFKAPITNTKPYSETTLRKVYNAIVGNYYKAQTQKLRTITDIQQARKFKAANFDYCTFSGTFTTRNDKALITHSGLLCVDFDHLNNTETLFNNLLKDDYFDTQLLFRSPSGDGLKWIIPIDTTQATHAENLNERAQNSNTFEVMPSEVKFAHSDYFTAIANYIKQTYGIEVDKSARNLSRACFLPHDPQAYLNPSLRTSSVIADLPHCHCGLDPQPHPVTRNP